MWHIYMMYPEINAGGGKRRGSTLMAQGLVRVDEVKVGFARTEKEAKAKCIELAWRQLRERGNDSVVIGYGIRNHYAPKGSKLWWKMTTQQLLRVLQDRKVVAA